MLGSEPEPVCEQPTESLTQTRLFRMLGVRFRTQIVLAVDAIRRVDVEYDKVAGDVDALLELSTRTVAGLFRRVG